MSVNVVDWNGAHERALKRLSELGAVKPTKTKRAWQFDVTSDHNGPPAKPKPSAQVVADTMPNWLTADQQRHWHVLAHAIDLERELDMRDEQTGEPLSLADLRSYIQDCQRINPTQHDAAAEND